MTAPEARPPVAVVLATLDRPEFLPDCLGSIVADLDAGDEVVVVEAGVAGGAAAALETLGAVRPATTVLGSPAGKSRQLNLGIARTRAEVLLFTDDDVRIAPGWSAAMAAAFDDPGVGIAFGRVVGLTHAPGTEETGLPPGEAPLVTAPYAHGAAMAIRARALREIGGFDERLGPGAPAYGEEHDVLLRLREAGWRAVITDAPPATHIDWRDDAAHHATALVYERGAGAFIGAAIRRRPGDGLRQLRWRLHYLRVAAGDGRGMGFAARATWAFTGGLTYGLRLRPRRFIPAADQENEP